MLLEWFDTRHATEIGITLADQFAAQSAAQSSGTRTTGKTKGPHSADPVRALLQRAEHEARSMPLNFYKRVKLANAFKWRLVEKGLEAAVASDVTQALVMHLSLKRPPSPPTSSPAPRSKDKNAYAFLLSQAQQLANDGAYTDAIAAYQAFLERSPRHADALNNLAAVLCQLGRFREAELHLRDAIGIKPKLVSAHFNLGAVLRARGQMRASEQALRRALKLAPSHVEARVSVAFTLLSLARLPDADAELQCVLKLMPRHLGARLGMAQLYSMEGRFEDAEALYRAILEEAPDSSGALIGMISLRKMTAGDAIWAQRLQQSLSEGVEPSLEANLHFALAKYYDDVEEFPSAFEHYRHGNEILKAGADGYDRKARVQMVDDLMRVYTSAAVTPTVGSSPSGKPLIVVGMPRSGTSLIEQIIASHPAAVGAGELDFWAMAMQRNEAALRRSPPDESLKSKLAESYLQLLARYSADALRVVDKTPVNADYLGLIHAVFPQARIIYVHRHPIDVCLSCYFQRCSAAQTYSRDLADLAHYYRQHRRLAAHWRTVLSPQTILEVRYEELIADQEQWTRRILDFVGLDWDPRCLDFHNAPRAVATASAWQLRQKIYRSSVGRWRNYERFIGPLRQLADVDQTIDG